MPTSRWSGTGGIIFRFGFQNALQNGTGPGYNGSIKHPIISIEDINCKLFFSSCLFVLFKWSERHWLNRCHISAIAYCTQLRSTSRRCTMKAVNALLNSGTLYRAKTVVINPLVGRRRAAGVADLEDVVKAQTGLLFMIVTPLYQNPATNLWQQKWKATSTAFQI